MSTKDTKPTNALLFLPDISGFTEFVHFTEISHSKHIISELLEVLIKANNSHLELAEVEGDALFFYKLMDTPNKAELDTQIRNMYIAFHTHLKRYEYERICRCGACSSAYNLTLKFVAHFGEIDFIEVSDIKKPYGSNVIQAHRLLKNEVPILEYALYTDQITSIKDKDKTMTLAYDFGDLSISYEELTAFKKELPYVPPIPNKVPKHKLLSFTQIIEWPALDLYEVISNFDYRLLWLKGVNKLDYEKNRVNRNGTKHQCLIDNQKNVDQITVTREVESNQLVYGESTAKIPFTKRFNAYYVLEEISKGKTQLTIEAYADFKPFGILLKRKFAKNFKKVISENINELLLLIQSGFKLETTEERHENN